MSPAEMKPAEKSPAADAVGDAQLLAAAIDHQDWAWPVLVERYGALVASITWSYRLTSADAAEVRQVVWMKLFETMSRIRQPECIAGWIRSVTRHECQRKLQEHRLEVPIEDDGTCEGESGDDFDGYLLAQERRAAFRQALVRLSGRDRVLLELLLDQPDLTYRELAVKLDMPIGSVGPTRQRCLGRLRAAPELARLVA